MDYSSGAPFRLSLDSVGSSGSGAGSGSGSSASTPTRASHRPLMLRAGASTPDSVSSSGLGTNGREPDTPTPGSRLKRLSLVARRESGVYDYATASPRSSGRSSPTPSSMFATGSGSPADLAAGAGSTSASTSSLFLAGSRSSPTTSGVPGPRPAGPPLENITNVAGTGVSPLSPLAASPLRRARPRPSSISYSPRPRSPGTPTDSPGCGSGFGSGSGNGYASGLGASSPVSATSALGLEATPERQFGRRSSEMLSSPLAKGPLTLADQHADLLRAIAARERRVTELRQELAQQEQALASLRSRWTAIANHAPTSTTSPAPARRMHTRARSGSVATQPRASLSVSSIASLPTVPDEDGPMGWVATDGDDDDLPPHHADDDHTHVEPHGANGEEPTAFGTLWSVIAQDADETIQEGKRFWGQLMRTVGAAAGGTVPEQDARHDQQQNSRHEERKEEGVRDSLNLGRLSTMLPSVSLPFGLPSAGPAQNATPLAHAMSPPRRPGSIRLRRPSLSPSPSSDKRSLSLSRTVSGQSTTSNTSIGSVASQMSVDSPAPGPPPAHPLAPSPSPSRRRLSAAEKRRNRTTCAGSPTKTPRGLMQGTDTDAGASKDDARPSPVNVVLDGVLW